MAVKDKPLQIKGGVYIVPEPDVDTDMIFHNRHLHITDPAEMGQWIFGNLPNHKDFPKTINAGDILITGHNFGCGSSRQQAVDGFIALGVSALVGESFGAIYKRNAINAGLPLLECAGILTAGLHSGDEIEIDLEIGLITSADGSVIAEGSPLGIVQKDIYFAGGLMELAQEERNN